ncbi:MAG: sensor histidine kinase, partial [Prochlorothrix sp.]
MTAFDVGAGLLAGSGLVLLYHLYYRRQQHLLIQVLRHQLSPRSLGLTSPFFGVLIHYQDHQNRLGQSLADFETLLEHLPLAYLEVDDDNQLQRCNPAAQALLKLPNVDRGRQRLLLELFRSYDLDQLIEKTRQTQTPCQREWSLNLVGTDLANPQPQPNLELRGYGIPLALGRIGVFLEDRREAVQLTQQRDRWVSDVAHELKTPLTSIRLVAETLVDRVAPPWQSWMERLLGEVVHLSHLVQDLLDLSRLDRRSPVLMVASLDFVDLVNTAWDSLEPISRRRQIDLHYHGPLDLFMEGDRSRLYQVLLNLLDNAIKYGPPRSVITVRLSVVPGDQVPIDRGLKSQTPSNSASSNPVPSNPAPINPASSN